MYFQYIISYINICTYVFSILVSSRAFVIIYQSSEPLSVDDSSIEAKIDSSSAILRLFSTIFLSENCAKVIISPVFSWDDVSYEIYENYGRITSDSGFRRDVYANALENHSSNTMSCEETILRVLGTYMRYPF